MRILVFQHLPVENPGVFLEFWAEAGVAYDTVEFDRDDPIPDLAPYDLLVVMGGPMDTWQEEAHPWLRREKAAIRRWVTDLRRPYLGICLGHQLLAAALDGHVGLMQTPEVGIYAVGLTEAGRADPLFAGFAGEIETLQWHGAEVARLPAGAEVLANSPGCAVQAIRVGAFAYGLQFHVETTASTVAAWNAIPDYAASLQRVLGADGAAALGTDVAARLPASTAVARRLNDNLMALIAAEQSEEAARAMSPERL